MWGADSMNIGRAGRYRPCLHPVGQDPKPFRDPRRGFNEEPPAALQSRRRRPVPIRETEVEHRLTRVVSGALNGQRLGPQEG